MKNDSQKQIKLHLKGYVLTLLAVFSTMASAGPFFQKDQDPLANDKAWSKVENMSDEFESTSLDLSKWQQEPVGNGWVWVGRPPGLFDPEAISVANGRLRVTVSALASPSIVKGKEYLYQGAIVRSLHASQNGWYFEAKMKANQTEMSSTFWLMSKNKDCQTKHELDIQENVGVVTPLTHEWAKDWDHIFHSNAIHRTTSCRPEEQRDSGSVLLEKRNWEKFYVYGAWWKSPTEILMFLDGEYQYTVNPTTPFNVPMWIQMAIETYDWNPVPADGGMVKKGNWEQRTTQYEWVRTWKVIDAGNINR